MRVRERKVLPERPKKGRSQQGGSSRANVATMDTGPSINRRLVNQTRICGDGGGTIRAHHPCAQQGRGIPALELGACSAHVGHLDSRGSLRPDACRLLFKELCVLLRPLVQNSRNLKVAGLGVGEHSKNALVVDRRDPRP